MVVVLCKLCNLINVQLHICFYVFILHYIFIEHSVQYNTLIVQVLGAATATHQPQHFYDHTHHSLSQAYLGHSTSTFSPSTGLYPSYLYNHPAPTYHLPASATDHSIHNLSSTTTKDFFQGPLDFSKDYSRDYTGRAEYSSQQSSPSLGSDTSSSPVYQPPHDSLYGSDVALLSHARYSAHLGDHNFKPVLDVAAGVARDPVTAVKRGVTGEGSMLPATPLLWNDHEVKKWT